MSGIEFDIEELTDIGTERANRLRAAGFETLEDVRRATTEELAAVTGISRRLAEQMKEELGGVGGEITGVTAERIAEIRDRFKHYEWERWYWRRPPAEVDVLIYGEGGIKFSGGGFGGLTHVISTLKSDPWYWVTFDVTTAHRQRAPAGSADMERVDLDEVSLSDYDELWLFGVAGRGGGPDDIELSASEINAVESFMDDGGGVLTTGDHSDLGEGITGGIPRVGKMRRYDAWLNTLRSGPGGSTSERDDTPQKIRVREYPEYRFWPRFLRTTHPHPVLCGPEGPIEILPDHQHEGAVNVPSSYPTSEWPRKGGHQPKVEPIAWAQVVNQPDPNSDEPRGTEFPVIGVYDGHRADVGRIAADATWHHWFDLNLRGGGSGFDDTPQGRQHLEKFEACFLNLAVWPAPPGRQSAMWNALLWGALWRGPLVMFDPQQAAGYHFGGRARNALGQFAPQCQIRHWCHDFMPIEVVERLDRLRELPRAAEDPEQVPGPVPVPVEEFVIGETVRYLLEEYREATDIVAYPGDEVLDEAVEYGTSSGLEGLMQYYESVAERGEQLTGSL